jgi:hypothetical protein
MSKRPFVKRKLIDIDKYNKHLEDVNTYRTIPTHLAELAYDMDVVRNAKRVSPEKKLAMLNRFSRQFEDLSHYLPADNSSFKNANLSFAPPNKKSMFDESSQVETKSMINESSQIDIQPEEETLLPDDETAKPPGDGTYHCNFETTGISEKHKGLFDYLLNSILEADKKIINVNEKGEVIINEQRIANSDLRSLLTNVFHRRANANLTGVDEFNNVLHSLQIPDNYFKNSTAKRAYKERENTIVDKHPMPTSFHTPSASSTPGPKKANTRSNCKNKSKCPLGGNGLRKPPGDRSKVLYLYRR